MMIERAGLGYRASDVELRHRCRNAPEFVRVNIDQRRAERGEPRLWPGLRRDASRQASQSLGRAQSLRRVRFLKAFLSAYGHRT